MTVNPFPNFSAPHRPGGGTKVLGCGVTVLLAMNVAGLLAAAAATLTLSHYYSRLAAEMGIDWPALTRALILGSPLVNAAILLAAAAGVIVGHRLIKSGTWRVVFQLAATAAVGVYLFLLILAIFLPYTSMMDTLSAP